MTILSSSKPTSLAFGLCYRQRPTSRRAWSSVRFSRSLKRAPHYLPMRPRREHNPCPPIASESRTAAATRRDGLSGSWRGPAICVSLPMLRRAHDRHRDIRAWLCAAASANVTHPDRQLMTITRRVTPSQLADISGLPAGRNARRSIHDHGLAVSRPKQTKHADLTHTRTSRVQRADRKGTQPGNLPCRYGHDT